MCLLVSSYFLTGLGVSLFNGRSIPATPLVVNTAHHFVLEKSGRSDQTDPDSNLDSYISALPGPGCISQIL